MEQGEEPLDAVVVGAGLSGLVAGRALVQAGRRIVVLEGRERIGGRILTTLGAAGVPVDRGAQWLGPGQHRLLSLTSELGLSTYPTGTGQKTAFELAGRFGASHIGFPLNQPLALIGTLLGMNQIEKAAKNAKKTPPWSGAARTTPRDESVADFLEARVASVGARTVLKSALGAVFCRRAEEVSMDLALYAIGRSGGFAHMQGVKGGAQERQFSLGAGSLVERLAAELKDRVKLGSKVRRVVSDSTGVSVETLRARFSARCVILAIPPPLIAGLEFEPRLPSQRWDVLQRSKMGHVIKYNLVYESPFWRKRGLSGTIWSTTGRVQVCYDTTPEGTEFGVLSALSVAQPAEDLRALPPEQRRDRVLKALAAHLGANALEPLEYHDMVWADEPFTGGGYSVTLPPGAFSLGPDVFSAAAGRIHFAGTETATEYPGYMEGAVESGQRAAKEVLRELAGRDD